MNMRHFHEKFPWSRRLAILGLPAFALAAVFVTAPAWSQSPGALPAPPKTRVEAVKETLHGTEIVDPYRWLEDQKSPETRAWIDAQNKYTQEMIGNLPGRDKLIARLSELMKIEVITTPVERGGRYFFSKRLPNQELFVHYVRKGLKGPDEVLLDPHPMSPDRTTTVSRLDISDDGKMLAYGVRLGGEDETTVQLMDIDSRKDLADKLPRARYSGVSLKPDKSGFYYSKYTSEGPRIYYHAMGSDPAKDAELFGKGYGPGKIIGAGLDEDGKYLVMVVFHGSAADQTEVYYKDTTKDAPVMTLVNDVKARFSPDIVGEQIFLQTNWNAPKNRILRVDLRNPARENWKEIIPESASPLQGFSTVGGNIFASYLENVSTRLKVFDSDGKHLRDISFPTIGSVGGMGGRWKSNEGFFAFSSFHVPTTIYRYDIPKGTQEVWAQLKVPVDSSALEVKQVWYESKDKTRIPMFIVHKKGLKLDGSNPTFLTGYGGFTVSNTPGFSSRAVLWAERGGVFALPNLRGGGEFGEAWHKAGMLANKQNVFDDFHAAAEWLIKNKYTSASKLAISGGSNGGLLVGAAFTQRPELFGAVVCSVPLLDMVRYHRFLVARFWVPEYGSTEDPAQFQYIHAYSPYHRVKLGTKYPAILFISGDSDTRVDPLHARKMTALMQASTGSDKPVLLLYDTKAGHSGGKPLSKQIEDLGDELGFLYWQLGAGQ